jgi:predicted deacetylase
MSSIDLRRSAAPKRLVVAIHDVGPRFEQEVEQLRDHLGAHVPAEQVALLVVPDHWGHAPIHAGTPFASRLRRWAMAGAEIFVHGWYHQDRSEHKSRSARLKAQHLTAGEAEFLGLDLATSRSRMADGKRLIEDIIGGPVAGFVAPAWLYGPAALEALAESGFALAEDHWRVWEPASGAILCKGPVITWASRSGPRIISSLAAAQLLPSALHAAQTVRLAVHPGDTGVPALLTSIDRVLDRLCKRRSFARYGDLLATAAERAA